VQSTAGTKNTAGAPDHDGRHDDLGTIRTPRPLISISIQPILPWPIRSA